MSEDRQHKHEHHPRAGKPIGHALSRPIAAPGALNAAGMAVVQRILGLQGQATAAIYANEREMQEHLIAALATGRSALPPILGEPSVVKATAAHAAADQRQATGAPAQGSGEGNHEAASGVEAMLAWGQTEVDDHADEWSKEGSIDKKRIGARTGALTGSFKCNRFISEALRVGGYVEPGTRDDGSVHSLTVDEMAEQVNEVETSGSLVGKTVQWFDIVPDIAHAQPGDLLVVDSAHRHDPARGHGHIGAISDIVYDTGAKQLRRLTVMEASHGGAKNEPAQGPLGARTTWVDRKQVGHEMQYSVWDDIKIVRARTAEKL